MNWIVIGVILYLLVGAGLIGSIMGSSKTSRGWRFEYFLNALREPGSGTFWTTGVVFWFPIVLFLVIRGFLSRKG